MGYRVKAAAVALTWCFGLVTTFLGCGGSEYMSVAPIAHESERTTAPASTVSQLTYCANEGAARMRGATYAIMFDVDLTESGAVREASVRESMVPDDGMTSCMTHALEAMAVPLSIMRTSQPFAPQSRGYMGSAIVLGAAVNLVPIVIVAAGVTIMVAITVHIADKTIEAIKRRRKAEALCYPRLHECLDNPKQPDWNRDTFGGTKDCGACFRECMKDERWPDYKCPPPGYRPN